MTKPLSKRETREKIAEATKNFKCAWVGREKVERREAEGWAHFSPAILEGDAELMYQKKTTLKVEKPKTEKPKTAKEAV